MDIQTTSQPDDQFIALISQMGDENGLVRQRARLMLVHLGKDSLPYLRDALHSKNANIRLEAVKALSEFHEPDVLLDLTAMLMDDDVGVRWTSAENLIKQGRDSLRPLLQSFIHNFDLSWMREGLHHILHVFKDRKLLNDEELVLFEKLDKHAIAGLTAGWTGDAAWAAEKALEVLDREEV
jgi:HEAT repeat protein